MKKAVKFIIFIFFIACFIYLGTRDYEIDTKKKINNKKTSEVLFNDDTVFTEVNHSKLLSRLSSSSANLIIYACIDSNKICASYGN
ncbi:MAG: hypothetical protein K6G37_02815, partial [Bacilli bacterium]|nr:hypothetical protein [Bacilli bacterium]